MVIDDATAYVMTANWSNSAFTKNREYIVADRVPADVAEIVRIFQADWNQQPFQPQNPNLVVSPDNSRQRIIQLIDSAKQSILLESEYMTDRQVLAHLGYKVKAGVDVTVMLSYQPKDLCTGRDSNADEAKALQAIGVTQFAFTQKVTMHAKAIVVDEKAAYVGSENFTANSLDNNRELGILVYDPGVVGQLARLAKQDFANK
jgi:phosphatidylserine/phosphatidylglycerophosphate/cardiolipin synthase-like enzyme